MFMELKDALGGAKELYETQLQILRTYRDEFRGQDLAEKKPALDNYLKSIGQQVKATRKQIPRIRQLDDISIDVTDKFFEETLSRNDMIEQDIEGYCKENGDINENQAGGLYVQARNFAAIYTLLTAMKNHSLKNAGEITSAAKTMMEGEYRRVSKAYGIDPDSQPDALEDAFAKLSGFLEGL